MIGLMMIVILGVLALWLSNADRKHPILLIAVGVLSIVLGGRAATLLSEAYTTSQASLIYANEEKVSDESDANVTDTVSVNDSTEEVEQEDAQTPDDAEADAKTTADNTTTLSVEPKASFRYLTLPRPDWVETEPNTNSDRFQVAVESGLHVRKRTAQQELRNEIETVVDRYVNEYLQSELASTLVSYKINESEVDGATTVNLQLDGKVFEIARERFDEQVDFDYGLMNQSHALVKLDKSVQKALDQRWSQVRAISRLAQTGLGGGALLLLLATIFGYLKLDTATRGYYTGRLQFGAAAAILAIIAVGAVCANWIPWM